MVKADEASILSWNQPSNKNPQYLSASGTGEETTQRIPKYIGVGSGDFLPGHLLGPRESDSGQPFPEMSIYAQDIHKPSVSVSS